MIRQAKTYSDNVLDTMAESSGFAPRAITTEVRPRRISFIVILDALLFGGLPLLGLFVVFTFPYGGISAFFTWYLPGELFGAGVCGIIGVGISPITSILFLVAAVSAWRGNNSGRIGLIILAMVVSLIQPMALSVSRYYSLVNNGNYDQDQSLLATRIAFSVVVVLLNLGCFLSPRANTFYKARSPH